jgi:hypothetical protein
MAKAEQYAQWIVANQNKKGTPEFETVAAAYREAKQLEAGDTAAQRKEAREAGARLPTSTKATLQTLRGGTLDLLTSLRVLQPLQQAQRALMAAQAMQDNLPPRCAQNRLECLLERLCAAV